MAGEGDAAGLAEQPAAARRAATSSSPGAQAAGSSCAQLGQALPDQPGDDRRDQQAMVEGRAVPPDRRHVGGVAAEQQQDRGRRRRRARRDACARPRRSERRRRRASAGAMRSALMRAAASPAGEARAIPAERREPRRPSHSCARPCAARGRPDGRGAARDRRAGALIASAMRLGAVGDDQVAAGLRLDAFEGGGRWRRPAAPSPSPPAPCSGCRARCAAARRRRRRRRASCACRRRAPVTMTPRAGERAHRRGRVAADDDETARPARDAAAPRRRTSATASTLGG